MFWHCNANALSVVFEMVVTYFLAFSTHSGRGFDGTRLEFVTIWSAQSNKVGEEELLWNRLQFAWNINIKCIYPSHETLTDGIGLTMHIDVLYWCCCIIISMKYLISWAAARRKCLIMNDVNKFLFLNAENIHNLKYVFIALNRIRHWQYKQTNEMNCFCSLRTPITCFETDIHTPRKRSCIVPTSFYWDVNSLLAHTPTFFSSFLTCFRTHMIHNYNFGIIHSRYLHNGNIAQQQQKL